MPPRQFTVRVWIALAIAVLITAAFVVSWIGIVVILMLFGSGLFAIFTRGIGNWISAHSALGPRISIAIVLLAMAAGLALAGWFLAPSALSKLQQISEQIPVLRAKIYQTQFGDLLLNFPGAESLLSGSGTLTTRTFQMISTGVVSPLFAGMAAIIGEYLAIQPALYKEGVVRLFPIPHRERAREILDYTIYNLRWWVVSKVIGTRPRLRRSFSSAGCPRRACGNRALTAAASAVRGRPDAILRAGVTGEFISAAKGFRELAVCREYWAPSIPF